jgi:hypothetical protein
VFGFVRFHSFYSSRDFYVDKVRVEFWLSIIIRKGGCDIRLVALFSNVSNPKLGCLGSYFVQYT